MSVVLLLANPLLDCQDADIRTARRRLNPLFRHVKDQDGLKRSYTAKTTNCRRFLNRLAIGKEIKNVQVRGGKDLLFSIKNYKMMAFFHDAAVLDARNLFAQDQFHYSNHAAHKQLCSTQTSTHTYI